MYYEVVLHAFAEVQAESLEMAWSIANEIAANVALGAQVADNYVYEVTPARVIERPSQTEGE